MPRALRLAAAAALLVALAPDAGAQSLFDRAKNAAKRTAQEAANAARETLVEEGMTEMNRLMLADGAFAGTASPWLGAEDGETVTLADLGGQAFVSADRLALVFCAGVLDAVVFQGRFDAADGERFVDLADREVSALLIAEGRTDRLRVSPRSTLTYGTLDLEPGENGGLVGEVVLAVGEDAVPRRTMPALFERTRVVEIAGQFRATPVDAITGVSCEPAAE